MVNSNAGTLRQPRLSARFDWLTLLRPVPVAFFLFPVTFALQVQSQSASPGLLPYALMGLSLVIDLMRGVASRERSTYSFTRLDMFPLVFAIVNFLHILVGIFLGGYSYAGAFRLLLINVFSVWMYIYASRVASRKEIRAALLAMSLVSGVVAVEWVAETYSKNVLQEIPEFQLDAMQYRLGRGSDEDLEDLPISLKTEYVAYGLVETHTTTGATVALGGFALLAAFPRLHRFLRVALLGGVLIVLLFGAAKLALLTFAVLAPAALVYLDREKQPVKTFLGLAFAGFVVIVGAQVFVAAAGWAQDIMLVKSGAYRETVMGIVQDSTWWNLFQVNWNDYLGALGTRPWILLTGQGPTPYGVGAYGHGGDFAFLELLAKYGLFVWVFFYYSLWLAIGQGRAALRQKWNQAEDAHAALVFGLVATLFLTISLLHYDTLLRKSVIVSFFFALGLVRRFSAAGDAERLD